MNDGKNKGKRINEFNTCNYDSLTITNQEGKFLVQRFFHWRSII